MTEAESPNVVASKSTGLSAKKITIVRRFVQIFTIIFLNSLFWSSVFKVNLSVFQTIFQYVPFISSPLSTFSNSGGFLEIMLGSMALRTVPFLLFGALILITVLFGRATCGWMCPAGFLQEIFAWAGSVTHNTRMMGFGTHDFLKKIKTLILIIILILIVPIVFITGNTAYSSYIQLLGGFSKNPLGFWSLDNFFFVAVPNFFTTIAKTNGVSTVFSNWLGVLEGFFYIIVVILIFYYPRFYCRYLCPYAACVKPFARDAITVLSRNPAKCVGRKACGKCEDVCPMQIRILDEPYARITGDGECILCGKCMETCDACGYHAVELSFFRS